MSDRSLWIFGYGSLVWRPAFPHRRRRIAYLDGVARRFWQGSTDHRGVPGRPGRVVTLVPDDDPSLAYEADSPAERCWGTAYEIAPNDPDQVLARLDHRERGGYERLEVDLGILEAGARFSVTATEGSAEIVSGLVYIAAPENENFLGPAPVDAIAEQIASSAGPSGANPEYVFELARSLRAMEAVDRHVFAVEAAVENRLGSTESTEDREGTSARSSGRGRAS